LGYGQFITRLKALTVPMPVEKSKPTVEEYASGVGELALLLAATVQVPPVPPPPLRVQTGSHW
jgi:hypothetical protein